MKGITTLLFDLDGTLVDSAPDIAVAMDKALLAMGHEPRGESRARQWIGNGAQKLMDRALTGDMHGMPAEADRQRSLALFLDAYREALCVRSALYPGVRDCVDQLHAEGYRLGCVTNKPEDLSRELLRQVGLGPELIPVVVGGDSLPQKKPDPAPLQHAMQALGATPEQTLMVGDSITDIRAAANAGTAIACVSYGYNPSGDIRECGVPVIDNLTELQQMLREAA